MDIDLGFILFWCLLLFGIPGLMVMSNIFSKKSDNAKKAKEEEKEKEIEQNFLKEKEKLLAGKHYELVESFIKDILSRPNACEWDGFYNFVGLYNQDTKEFGDKVVSDKEVEIFTQLLNAKGFNFSTSQVENVLGECIDMRYYNNFKNKMLSINPKSFKDFVENYLTLYSGNPFGYHPVDENGYMDPRLERLLEENKIYYTQEELNKIVDDIKISRLEKKLKSGDAAHISMKTIDLMNGFDFERFLKTLFEKMSYIVKHTQLTSDQGADLVIEKFGKTTVVQAKRSVSSISNKAIQEVVASIKHYGANDGMVVTNSKFTSSAIKLANSNNVDLVDRTKLTKLIADYM